MADSVAANVWTRAGSTPVQVRSVNVFETVHYEFSSAVNSSILNINADIARVCLNADIAAASGGANTVQIHVSDIGTEGTGSGIGSTAPSELALTDGVCVTLTRGRYFAVVTNYAAGTSRVTVTAGAQ